MLDDTEMPGQRGRVGLEDGRFDIINALREENRQIDHFKSERPSYCNFMKTCRFFPP